MPAETTRGNRCRRLPRRARQEDGAAAIEFALIVPVLVLLLFGLIEFGMAFLQVQSIRAGVREGGRAAAVGAQVSTTQQRTVTGSVGAIPSGHKSLVQVQSSEGGRCTPQNIGSDVTVSYNTASVFRLASVSGCSRPSTRR